MAEPCGVTAQDITYFGKACLPPENIARIVVLMMMGYEDQKGTVAGNQFQEAWFPGSVRHGIGPEIENHGAGVEQNQEAVMVDIDYFHMKGVEGCLQSARDEKKEARCAS